MTLTYIGALPDDRWAQVLTHYLAHCDAWAVHVPEGEGPLGNGRATFAALPGAEVAPWVGMRDAVRITGPLTAGAAAAFRSAEASLVAVDPQHKLWDYQLLRDDRVVVQVGDFTDLLVDEPDAEVRERLGLSAVTAET